MTAALTAWLVTSLALYVAARFVPGVKLSGAGGALVVGAVYGVLHWLLAKLLFVVIGVATFGLGFLLFFVTLWVVSALLLKLTDEFTDQLHIDGFVPALGMAAVMSVVGAVLRWVLPG